MGKLAGEYRFELRLRKLFEKAGYAAIKCARSKPLDLIIMKDGTVIAIEVKGARGILTEEQLEMQINLAKKAGVNYAIFKQMKKGKINVSSSKGLLSKEALNEIQKVLGKRRIK
jgi:Holliday junction resolvase